MMQQKIKWGILGTASIARRRFMPAVQMSANAEAVAIASRDRDRAQGFAAEFDIPKHYGSYLQVLDDAEVEAVYIPLPNHLHAEWTIRAAEAGKHVLCEKPMAVDALEAKEMAATCEANGVLLMEGFMYRLNPRTLKIKQLVNGGALGGLRTVVIQQAFTIDPAKNTRLIPGKGAGSIMDVGCYCINFARYIFGSDPVSVMANQHLDEKSDSDLTTAMILEFPASRFALISCSFESAYRNSIVLTGSSSVLKADKFFSPPNEGTIGFVIEQNDGSTQHFEHPAVNQFVLEIEHFSDCILNSTKPLLDPKTDAVGNAVVIDAARESAASGARVGIAVVS